MAKWYRIAILIVLLGASLQAEPLELSLESARQRALENHPTLAKLEAKLEEMRGRVDEVLSGGNPRLEIQAQYLFLTPQLGFSTPRATCRSSLTTRLVCATLSRAFSPPSRPFRRPNGSCN